MGSFNETLPKTSGFVFPVGENTDGTLITSNLEEISHLLICGATGTGKSVFLHSLLLSLIFHNTPEKLRLFLYDSKLVEFSVYNGCAHMLIPTITDAKRLNGALAWAESEINKRLESFSASNDRSLKDYNDFLWMNFLSESGLPRIVFVIDDITSAIIDEPKTADRVRQIMSKGRSVGLNLILVTQTPTWKATKQISALFRARVVFSAATAAESKFLIGKNGAQDLGMCGSAYFSVAGKPPVKVNTIMASDTEASKILDSVQKAHYDQSLTKEIVGCSGEAERDNKRSSDNEDYDELLPAAIDVVLEVGQASVSMLQRRLKLSYGRAARLVDQMEEKGVVGPFEGSKPRVLLITKEQWAKMQELQNRHEQETDTSSTTTEYPPVKPTPVKPAPAGNQDSLLEVPILHKIVLHRKNSIVGCLKRYSVFLDREFAGYLKTGETIEIETSPGYHVLELAGFGKIEASLSLHISTSQLTTHLFTKMNLKTSKIEIFKR